MSQVTYSRNPVVNGAVSISTTTSSSSAVYTAPATGYAICDITMDTGNAGTSTSCAVTIGTSQGSGIVYFLKNTGGTLTGNMPTASDSNGGFITAGINAFAATVVGVIVPPGKSIFFYAATSGAVTNAPKLNVQGVELKNG